MPKYQIHIPADIRPHPEPHEISAAVLMAKYFKSDITFIKRNSNGKSADFKVGNVIWEVKAPKGNGKRTIQNNLRVADDQSPYIILDLRRCKMHVTQAENRVRFELTKANKIKKLLLITKSGTVLDFK